MTESINTVVIGAGVVGLAAARALAMSGKEVVVLEQHEAIGQETSSRNSEVVHAGIYYPNGSLKARHCVSGKHDLYVYCESRSIPHRRIGKLIVAVDPSDTDRLRAIAAQAAANGVDDLRWLERSELTRLEPAVSGNAALLSPSSGIVDVHALMQALQADLEAAGGGVALRSRLLAVEATGSDVALSVDSHGETTRLLARNVVNSAGLHASAVARMLHGPDVEVPTTLLARGVYFDYAAPAPFARLVYPLPHAGGLGIHATLDLAGALRFGPDIEWISEIDYTVDPARAEAFAAAIATYWPDVDAAMLKPSYAGIRPKLAGPDEPPADFRITRTALGGATIVDLLGIESPGLTSTLAIAKHVSALLPQ